MLKEIAGDTPQSEIAIKQHEIVAKQSERAMRLIAACVVGGSLGAVLFALQAEDFAHFVSAVGVALAVAGAALLAGGLLGFLFGIPRTLQQNTAEGASESQRKDDADRSHLHGPLYQGNTSLEQISDWLTKILVGVGLTQISTLPEALQKYADYASVGLGNFPNSKLFAVALLIFFLICGFLISYLWTRLYLAGDLRLADLGAFGGQLFQQVNVRVSELRSELKSEQEKQAELDAKALNMVEGVLNPAPGAQQISPEKVQEELVAAIGSASQSARGQIFYRAQNVRSENWYEREKKPKMEKTIPIFKALVACDKDDVYHANHGQLAFALKDQRQPNWAEAESELTRAIELRGPWQEQGWLIYEFNRAFCRINMDNAFRDGHESADETKQAILADLRAGANSPDVAQMIENDPVARRWLEINHIAWPLVAIPS